MFKKLLQLTHNEFEYLLRNCNFFKLQDLPILTQEDEDVTYYQKIKIPNKQRKGSLVVLVEKNVDNKTNFVFCQKRISPEKPSQPYLTEIQFVGGMSNIGESPKQCLLREINEELYFGEKSGIEIVNSLPSTIINVANIEVTPFIGILTKENYNEEISIRDKKEIRSLISFSTENLINGYHEKGVTKIKELKEIGPTYEMNQVPQIWGISARILTYLFTVMNSHKIEN